MKKINEMNIMKRKTRIINTNLNEVGQKLGLNKKEIYTIMTNITSGNEHISFATGPIPYLGSMYGTIGIKDFQ